MTIPESQLETWSHQGAITTAKDTHESIRNALYASTSPVRDKDMEVYLQGSYRNSTNTRGDSDVDVVAQLNSTYHRDLSSLPADQRALYERLATPAPYHFRDFRRDVLTALQRYYGLDSVENKNKAIRVLAGSGRLTADVVACLQYRRYTRFRGFDDQEFVEGIVFYTVSEGREIINYPKLHYENGVTKHQATSRWFKPSVRMFKNARSYLVDHGALGRDIAPSYFLECLIYNVPDSQFGENFQRTYTHVVNWLANADMSRFVCQNRQVWLFGVTPEQWSQTHARTLVDGFVVLWNKWRG